jgi:hypothetical protein
MFVSVIFKTLLIQKNIGSDDGKLLNEIMHITSMIYGGLLLVRIIKCLQHIEAHYIQSEPIVSTCFTTYLSDSKRSGNRNVWNISRRKIFFQRMTNRLPRFLTLDWHTRWHLQSKAQVALLTVRVHHLAVSSTTVCKFGVWAKLGTLQLCVCFALQFSLLVKSTEFNYSQTNRLFHKDCSNIFCCYSCRWGDTMSLTINAASTAHVVYHPDDIQIQSQGGMILTA